MSLVHSNPLAARRNPMITLTQQRKFVTFPSWRSSVLHVLHSRAPQAQLSLSGSGNGRLHRSKSACSRRGTSSLNVFLSLSLALWLSSSYPAPDAASRAVPHESAQWPRAQLSEVVGAPCAIQWLAARGPLSCAWVRGALRTLPSCCEGMLAGKLSWFYVLVQATCHLKEKLSVCCLGHQCCWHPRLRH
jgi:hypothetical protein